MLQVVLEGLVLVEPWVPAAQGAWWVRVAQPAQGARQEAAARPRVEVVARHPGVLRVQRVPVERVALLAAVCAQE